MALIELNEGARPVTITANGITARRLFTCGWDERYAIVTANFAIGAPHPDAPGCWISSVRLEGLGTDRTGAKIFELCKIIVEYSSLSSTQEQQVGYMEQSFEMSGEMLSRPGGYWEIADMPIEKEDRLNAVFYPRGVYTLKLTIDDLNAWIAKLKDLIGKVNSSTWLGGSKERWLFAGYDANDFIADTGEKRWKLTMRFIYRGGTGVNWNTVWRKEMYNIDTTFIPAGWDRPVFGDIDGVERIYLYEKANFNAIFGNPDVETIVIWRP